MLSIYGGLVYAMGDDAKITLYHNERTVIPPNNSEYILIVAGSARMPAQAARAAGLKPLLIDLYADLDTQDYAQDFKQIPSLAAEYLMPAVDYFIERYAVTAVIYGSGFESHPDSLCYLAGRLRVLGNTPDTFIRLHDKPAFFAGLDQLNIPYPVVCFNPPEDEGHWLVKPMQAQGGVGIKRYHPKDGAEPAVYWQQYQPGAQHSVLFLADGQQAQVIGFNTQWTIDLGLNQEFLFSGIINYCDLPAALQQRVIGWLRQLVPELGLKGLNTLDFISSGDGCRVLEVNPRPSASMQLYDADLLTGHIKACMGELTDYPDSYGYTGYQIVYADRDIIIPDGFAWPDGCMDLPGNGVMCRKGQPICSIIAHQKRADSVMDALLTQQLNLLKRFTSHGI